MKHWFVIIILVLITSNLMAQPLLAPALKIGAKKWGYINEKGQYIIPPRYEFCYNFSECGLAGVYDNLNDKALFINMYGDTIIKDNDEYELIQFEDIVSMVGFVDSVLIVKKNEYYGAINPLGEIIIPIEYDHISNFNEGLAVAIKDGLYFILDKDKNAIQVNIKNLNKLNPFHNGFASFETNEKLFGFINSIGEVIIEPRFLSVGIFEEGLAWAEASKNKFGYINSNGEWVIAPRLWKAYNFNKGSYYAPVVVINGEGVSFISKTGQELDLDGEIRVLPTFGFNDGIAIVKKGGNYGGINFFGHWKVVPIFRYIWRFSNGYAVAQKDSYLGIIDENGNWTAQPEFTKIGKLVQINSDTN